MRRKEPTLIFGGRFQPLHLGHLSVINSIQSEYDRDIIIGIVNPDPKEILAGDGEDWVRFAPSMNPLNYWERLVLFQRALKDTGIYQNITAIVPLPRPSINHEKANRFLPHGPKDFVLTERWGDEIESWKERKYRENGYGIVKVNPSRFSKTSQISSGSLIRNLIALDDSRWSILVPKVTISYLNDIEFEQRVKDHMESEEAEDSLYEFFNNHPLGDHAAKLFSQAVKSSEIPSIQSVKDTYMAADEIEAMDPDHDSEQFRETVYRVFEDCFDGLDMADTTCKNIEEEPIGIFKNNADSKIFNKFRRKYDSDYIIVGVRNNEELTMDDLNWITDVFNDNIGSVGFIVYNGDSEDISEIKPHLQSLFLEDMLVIPISTDDLQNMIQRKISGESPGGILDNYVTEFELESSL